MNEGGEFFPNTSSIQFLDIHKMTNLQENCHTKSRISIRHKDSESSETKLTVQQIHE
jgi:hypothetical protein